MPANKPKFYLTTPIYYTNGLPHIGHTYSTIVCDTIRRYKRMRGYDVVMTTGTDEHGVNVERSAKKAGVPESEFVAKMAAEWRALWDELGVQGPGIFTWSALTGRYGNEQARFEGEPGRGSLTQPPAGYQTPSSNYPYGFSDDSKPGWKIPTILDRPVGIDN